jgi:hypothetical protein
MELSYSYSVDRLTLEYLTLLTQLGGFGLENFQEGAFSNQNEMLICSISTGGNCGDWIQGILMLGVVSIKKLHVRWTDLD